MATLGELNIKIAANVAQLSQDVTKVEREMRKMRNAGVKASKQLNTAAKGIKGFKNLARNVLAAAVAFKGLESSVRFMLKVTENAALLKQGVAALDGQVKKLGMTGEKALGGLRKASQGLIDDKTLVEAANRAVSLGIKFEDLGDFMEIARAKARDMGTDTKTAFGDLVTALGRVSPMILDNLGITVKVGEANKEYAESIGKTVAQLSAQEKKLAFQKAALDAGREATERHNLAVKTSAEKFQEARAAVENLALSFGKTIGPALTDLLDNFTRGIVIIDKFIKKIQETKGGLRGETFEDMQKRVKARVNAERGAQKETAAASRQSGLQTRINQNAKFIEEEQKLWERELNLIAANDAAEEKIAARAMARKKAEQAQDKILLDQKMDMTREITRAAASAEAAGLISFKSQQRVAAAMALVNAYLAISNVWAEKSNSVYETIAKVAYTAGQVFGVVSAIRGVSVSGGGGGGASPGAPPISGGQSLLDQDRTTVQGGGQTTIVFQGGTFIGGDKDAVARDLTPAIEKAIADGQGA